MRAIAIFAAIFIFTSAALAQVQTVVSPFDGSSFLGQYTSDFDRVTILVSVGDGYRTQSVEGNVRSTLFKAPDGKSQLEVLRNFELALDTAGFQTLFNRPILPKRFDTPEGSALRDWIKELADANNPRSYVDDAGRNAQIELNNIYAFPDHYLSATRTSDGVETVFALTYNGQRNSYLLEEVTRAAMEQGAVTISEAQLSSGIEEEGKAILYGVQFDVGSSILRPSSESSIEIIANVLRERPGRFYVVGHTSDTGSFELNMALSQDRAQAIIDALGKDYGIDVSRLQAAGVGPVAPLASNQNDAGRQLNRRVELVERLEE